MAIRGMKTNNEHEIKILQNCLAKLHKGSNTHPARERPTLQYIPRTRHTPTEEEVGIRRMSIEGAMELKTRRCREGRKLHTQIKALEINYEHEFEMWQEDENQLRFIQFFELAASIGSAEE